MDKGDKQSCGQTMMRVVRDGLGDAHETKLEVLVSDFKFAKLKTDFSLCRQGPFPVKEKEIFYSEIIE